MHSITFKQLKEMQSVQRALYLLLTAQPPFNRFFGPELPRFWMMSWIPEVDRGKGVSFFCRMDKPMIQVEVDDFGKVEL